MKEEMICKNCKYHYIEEISFDFPQSCCSKRSSTTEQWCKCNNFEYGDRYIEKLQNNWNELKKWLIQLQKFKGINQQGFSWGVAQEVLDKMQEIESGKNE